MANKKIRFYDSGEVRRIYLMNNAVVTNATLEYTFDLGVPLDFGLAGQVIQGRLGMAVRVDDVDYAEETWLRFDENGVLVGEGFIEDWTGVP